MNLISSRVATSFTLSKYASRMFHASSIRWDIKWRMENNMPSEPRLELDEISMGPEYTFLDGRPVPYGYRQYKKIQRQRELSEKTVQLLGEIEFAIKREKLMKEQERLEAEAILSRKLQPKGSAYKPKYSESDDI